MVATPEQFTYDNDGNLLTDGKFTYTWDAENRLIKAEYSDTRIEFTYDYMGRRTNKKLYGNNVLTSETKFTYDGWNLVAEYNGSNVLQNSSLWGEDLSGSLQGAGGVGGLLLVNDTIGVYLPIYDGNGNITTYLDNSGNTVATYEYDPFGKIICEFGTKADDMLYRFSTKYFDKETSLYYYGYRYYNPETSRWLSRDPIGERGGINVYEITQNNIINKIDYLGLKTKILVFTDSVDPQADDILKELRASHDKVKENITKVYNTYKGFTSKDYGMEFSLDGEKVASFEELMSLFDKYYGIEEIEVPDNFEDARKVLSETISNASASDKDHIYIITHGLDGTIRVKNKDLINSVEFFQSLNVSFKDKDTHKFTLRACLMNDEDAKKIKDIIKAAEITYSVGISQRDILNINKLKDIYSLDKKNKIMNLDFKVIRETDMKTQ